MDGARVGVISPPLRVAVVGAGFIADYHLRVLHRLPRVSVVGICDVDMKRAVAAQRKWGLAQATSSLQEVLQTRSIDVVHVLVPPPFHGEVAASCLENGFNVFLEKPATTSLAECRELQALAVRVDRKVGVSHNESFNPTFQRLVQAIRDCRLGQLQHVTACWNRAPSQLQLRQYEHWMLSEPGNIILDQAVHPLSQVQFLLGNLSVSSSLASRPLSLPTGQTFYQSWQASLVCERGTAQAYFGFEQGFNDYWLHVVAEDGAAFVDLRRNTLRISEKRPFMEPVDDLVDGLAAAAALGLQSAQNFADYVVGFLKITDRCDAYYTGIRASISRFYEALLLGQEPPVTLQQPANIVAACEEMILAAGGSALETRAQPTSSPT